IIEPGTSLYTGSFTPDQTPGPGLYSLQVLTHCSPNLNSSGAVVGFNIKAPVCPIVTSFILSKTAADAATITAVIPTSEDTHVTVLEVGVILYKVDPNFGAIPANSTTLSSTSTSYTFTRLSPGNYYATLTTQCNTGQSDV